ncbi:hypothetical protein CEUSTIGMA_g7135.t1 [Chlamydomonas eustigma]|uniref:Glycosylphosphatidylinositol anchor attachment 1 protein n=1 Tax=Chlamydomonas eustigma TaxID=1157962 RepID=A0A250X9E0_9CHLO|nr:hypothetical protein CEUSTIGMA_g7135.t1 [Chlamydomonas eustigma]|eukprot:GAX79694.1 hypothetical protein CEUSTIGMA_g7135.t1 [Chlamydomonas eustigma]
MVRKIKKKPLPVLIDALITRSDQVTYFLVILGILGLATLPLQERKVKVDEKSLLIGGAKSTLRSESQFAVQQGLDALKIFNDDFHIGQKSFNLNLFNAIESMGLEGYLSEYKPAPSLYKSLLAKASFTNFPSMHEKAIMEQRPKHESDSPSSFNITTSEGCPCVHGILRSQRGDGKEAIVLVTPMHLSHKELLNRSHLELAGGSASLLFGAAAMLMGHLNAVHWLAKDLVWVIPDAGCPHGGAEASLQQWVRQYQLPDQQWAISPHASPEAVFGRAGIMQQAVVLDTTDSGHQYSTMEVLLEGFQGQLPKLDMYHLLRYYSFVLQVPRLQMRGGDPAPVRLLDLFSWDQASRTYLSKLLLMARVMSQQGSGKPTGTHAVFKELLVDAATVKLSNPQHHGAVPPNCHPTSCALFLAEYLELIVRSFSNLSERFHHSYFLYLQTGPDTFVTVEMYIIPVVVFLLGLVLQAAASTKFERKEPHHMNMLPGSESQRVAEAGFGSEDLKPGSDIPDPRLELTPSLLPSNTSKVKSPDLMLWLRCIFFATMTSTFSALIGLVALKEVACHASDISSISSAARSLQQLLPHILSRATSTQTDVVILLSSIVSWALILLMLFILPFWASKWIAVSASAHVPYFQPLNLHPASLKDQRERVETPPNVLYFNDRLRTVALSLIAAALSALACINWALAYMASMLLLLFVVLAWPVLPCANSSSEQEAHPSHQNSVVQRQSSQSTTSRARAFVSVLSIALLSPPAIVGYMIMPSIISSLLSNLVLTDRSIIWKVLVALLQDIPSHAIEMQCNSQNTVLWVFWGLYVPLWSMCASANVMG